MHALSSGHSGTNYQFNLLSQFNLVSSEENTVVNKILAIQLCGEMMVVYNLCAVPLITSGTNLSIQRAELKFSHECLLVLFLFSTARNYDGSRILSVLNFGNFTDKCMNHRSNTSVILLVHGLAQTPTPFPYPHPHPPIHWKAREDEAFILPSSSLAGKSFLP